MATATQVVLPGIIGAVGQPQADHIRVNLLGDVDVFYHVLNRPLPDRLKPGQVRYSSNRDEKLLRERAENP
jgi:hypothetical protein